MADSRPIGIFDSGIGGLTVAHALRETLPHESIVYFGDTAHLPYGDKSKESIASYSRRITEFLLDHNCKAIIIACNTASAYGMDAATKAARGVHVFNVIDPVVKHIADHKAVKKVGVIGTKGTISSRIYPRKVKAASGEKVVVSQATPLLAPMIEEGFYNNTISQTIINSYLSKKTFKDIDSLVLGCTHYPLIKKEVQNFYDRPVQILDSAEVVAQHVANHLDKTGCLAGKRNQSELKFFVSDFTRSFEKSTKIFFGEEVHLEERRIW